MSERIVKEPIPTYWKKSSVEAFASAISEKLNFKAGTPVEHLVHSLNGVLHYGWQSEDEREGGSIFARDYDDFSICLSEHTSALRDRFTIAHELGHLFLHLQKVKKDDANAAMRATRHIKEDDQEQRRAEWEANWFAAQLLMPRDKFYRCAKDYGVSHAADVFGVSKTAAQVRYDSIERDNRI